MWATSAAPLAEIDDDENEVGKLLDVDVAIGAAEDEDEEDSAGGLTSTYTALE